MSAWAADPMCFSFFICLKATTIQFCCFGPRFHFHVNTQSWCDHDMNWEWHCEHCEVHFCDNWNPRQCLALWEWFWCDWTCKFASVIFSCIPQFESVTFHAISIQFHFIAPMLEQFEMIQLQLCEAKWHPWMQGTTHLSCWTPKMPFPFPITLIQMEVIKTHFHFTFQCFQPLRWHLWCDLKWKWHFWTHEHEHTNVIHHLTGHLISNQCCFSCLEITKICISCSFHSVVTHLDKTFIVTWDEIGILECTFDHFDSQWWPMVVSLATNNFQFCVWMEDTDDFPFLVWWEHHDSIPFLLTTWQNCCVMKWDLAFMKTKMFVFVTTETKFCHLWKSPLPIVILMDSLVLSSFSARHMIVCFTVHWVELFHLPCFFWSVSDVFCCSFHLSTKSLQRILKWWEMLHWKSFFVICCCSIVQSINPCWHDLFDGMEKWNMKKHQRKQERGHMKFQLGANGVFVRKEHSQMKQWFHVHWIPVQHGCNVRHSPESLWPRGSVWQCSKGSLSIGVFLWNWNCHSHWKMSINLAGSFHCTQFITEQKSPCIGLKSQDTTQWIFVSVTLTSIEVMMSTTATRKLHNSQKSAPLRNLAWHCFLSLFERCDWKMSKRKSKSKNGNENCHQTECLCFFHPLDIFCVHLSPVHRLQSHWGSWTSDKLVSQSHDASCLQRSHSTAHFCVTDCLWMSIAKCSGLALGVCGQCTTCNCTATGFWHMCINSHHNFLSTENDSENNHNANENHHFSCSSASVCRLCPAHASNPSLSGLRPVRQRWRDVYKFLRLVCAKKSCAAVTCKRYASTRFLVQKKQYKLVLR